MTTSRAGQWTSSAVSSDSEWRSITAASGCTSGAVSTGRPQEIPLGPHRLIFEAPIPGWSRPLLLRTSAFGELDENWDAYGARPIAPYCALIAAELILNLLESDSPQPAAVPTTRGGIQLEWHRVGANLELEVTSYGRLSVFFEDERTGEEQQLMLSGDLSALDPLSDRVAG